MNIRRWIRKLKTHDLLVALPAGRSRTDKIIPRLLGVFERKATVERHEKRDPRGLQGERQDRRRARARAAKLMVRFGQELAHKSPRPNARKFGKRRRSPLRGWSETR